MPPPALSTFLVSDLAELEWQQLELRSPVCPDPGPLFKNLSQATCVGARKSNSAEPRTVPFRCREWLEKAHSLYVFVRVLK